MCDCIGDGRIYISTRLIWYNFAWWIIIPFFFCALLCQLLYSKTSFIRTIWSLGLIFISSYNWVENKIRQLSLDWSKNSSLTKFFKRLFGILLTLLSQTAHFRILYYIYIKRTIKVTKIICISFFYTLKFNKNNK